MAARILLLLVMMMAGPASAASTGSIGLGELFGFADTGPMTVSEREQASLGCLITAAGIGVATILFSGAAIAVSGGQGAATATTVAIPVLAAVLTAGCALGSQAAPGIIWLHRNSEALFGKVVNVIPAEPLTKVLPLPDKPLSP